MNAYHYFTYVGTSIRVDHPSSGHKKNCIDRNSPLTIKHSLTMLQIYLATDGTSEAIHRGTMPSGPHTTGNTVGRESGEGI